MKKLFLLLPLLLVMFSCSEDDEPVPQVTYEKVPIIAVDAPETAEEGETYVVEVTYSLPTTCHKFSSLRFEQTGTTYVFDVVNYFTTGPGCVEDDSLTEMVSFDFVAEEVESYIFKFWQGVNDQGNDIYLTVEIPVETNST